MVRVRDRERVKSGQRGVEGRCEEEAWRSIEMDSKSKKCGVACIIKCKIEVSELE